MLLKAKIHEFSNVIQERQKKKQSKIRGMSLKMHANSMFNPIGI